MVVPEIRKSDITIDPKHTQGFDEERCIEALWLFYCFAKENITKFNCNYSKENESAVKDGYWALYAISALGEFQNDDFSQITVDLQKEPINIHAKLPHPNQFAALENLGFSVTNIKLLDESKPKSKLTGKDLLQFSISYPQNSELLLGLKLFASVCVKFKNEPFFTCDIRIMFKGVKKFIPQTIPLEEVIKETQFDIISETDKTFILAFNKTMNELEYDCGGNISHSFLCHKSFKYGKTGTVDKAKAAEIYVNDNGEITLRYYLYNVDVHQQYIENAPPHIKDVFTFAGSDCKFCNTKCAPGKSYTIDGKLYQKCVYQTFYIYNPTTEKLSDYISLLSKFYPKNNKLKIK